MKQSNFKAGDVLTAAAIECNALIFPIEVIVAAKNKRQLKEALDSMRIEYDSRKFKRVELTPKGQ